MRRCGLSCLVLLLIAANAVSAADRASVTKEIHASSGPWAVTLSINFDYPYGGGQRASALFSAADGFAFQAGDVLTIQYDSGLWCAGTYVSVGTCVDGNGYRIYAPSDDRPQGASTTYAPSRYMNPATYPIYLMQLVGTFADARGQIAGTPFKVGNGPVNVTVPAGAAQLQLGSNLYGYSDARDYFTVLKATVSGPAPAVMKSAGSMAQVAAGGGWKTTIVLVNSGAQPAKARLSFYEDSGRPLVLPLTLSRAVPAAPVSASTLEESLAAGGSMTVESAGLEDQPVQAGWAQLLSDGDVTGFAIFGQRSGDQAQEAVVPLETRRQDSYVLWFDQTGGLVMGVAVANLAPEAANVQATARDESGAVVGSGTFPLPAMGHTSFELAAMVSGTGQARGTVEFQAGAGGAISVLGLRFRGATFTTVPVIAK